MSLWFQLQRKGARKISFPDARQWKETRQESVQFGLEFQTLHFQSSIYPTSCTVSTPALRDPMSSPGMPPHLKQCQSRTMARSGFRTPGFRLLVQSSELEASRIPELWILWIYCLTQAEEFCALCRHEGFWGFRFWLVGWGHGCQVPHK